MKINEKIINNESGMASRPITDRKNTSSDELFTELKAGNVIEGTVKEIKDKTKIEFKIGDSHKEISLSNSAVRNTYVGDTRRFLVESVSADKVVLKDLGSTSETNRAVAQTGVESNLASLVDGFRETMGDKEKEDTDSIKQLSDKDCSELKAEGFSIEDYKAEVLVRALARIKNAYEERKELITNQKDELKQERQSARKQGIRNALDNNRVRELIAEKLEESNLPVTEDNIVAIATALGMSTDAGINGNTIAYLMRNELEVTPDNVFKASHCGTIRKENVSEAVWESVLPGVNEVINRAGELLGEINENETAGITQADAKWMLEYEIPITEENLVLKKRLDNLGTEGFEEEDVITRAAAAIAEGKEAKQAELISLNDPYNNSDKELREAITRINERLKLEEIRLVLTVKASKRLYENGIDVRTADIEDTINGLRNLEKEYYIRLIGERNRAVNDSNVNQEELTSEEKALLAMKTADSFYEIGRASTDLLAETYERRHSITVAELATEAKAAAGGENVAAERISLSPGRNTVFGAYEKAETQVRYDLGDSIQKAFGNIDAILAEAGLELTDANRRAVKILGRNNMELSASNINNMKYYDAKVTGLTEKMQPAIVVEMINRGINPLETDVDTLYERVNDIIRETGPAKEEKFSSFLVNLESREDISEQVRSAYIGIYRLLYQIAKRDGAAVGALVNSGKELTLSNLLTEVRSLESSGMDILVDDNTGTRMGAYANSITQQIRDAFEYNVNLVENILDNTSARAWNEALGSNIDENLSPEGLNEKLIRVDNNIDETLVTEAEAVRSISGNATIKAQFLLSFGDIDTVRNRKLLAKGAPGYGTVDLAALTDNETEEAFREEYLRVTEKAAADAMTGFDFVNSASDAGKLTEILDRCRLLGGLAREGHYRFRTDGENGAEISLTIVHDNERAGTVAIEIKKGEDRVYAQLHLGESVNGSVTAENAEMLSEVEKLSEELHRRLLAGGFKTGSIRFYEDRMNEDRRLENLAKIKGAADGTEKTSNRRLYSLAKIFIETTTLI